MGEGEGMGGEGEEGGRLMGSGGGGGGRRRGRGGRRTFDGGEEDTMEGGVEHRPSVLHVRHRHWIPLLLFI